MNNAAITMDQMTRLTTRIGLLATGSYLLAVSSNTFWSNSDLLWHWPSILLLFAGYGLAFTMLIMSMLKNLDHRWAWLVLAGVLFALFGQYVARLITLRPGNFGTSDAVLFSNYGAHLQLLGINPYSWNLTDSYTAYRISNFFQTPMLSGDASAAINYPALHFLVVIPFKWLGIEEMRILYVLAYAGVLIMLYRMAPPVLRPIILLPLIVNPDYVGFALGWVTDYVWLLLLVAMVAAWRRPAWRAVLYGLACAYKQIPWFLAPFILMRLLLDDADEHPASAPAQRSLYFFGVAGLIFVLVNLPYIIADFPAWREGVFEPAASPLIIFGSGFSTLTQVDIAPFPKEFYSATLVIVTAALVVITLNHFERLKNAIWIYPGIMLWFSYRSLQSYFLFWIPLLLVVVAQTWRDTTTSDRQPVQLASGFLTTSVPLVQRGWRWLNGMIRRTAAEFKGMRYGAAIAGSVAALGIAGLAVYYLLYDYSADVTVTDVSLYNNVYRVNEIELAITNRSTIPFSPAIGVQEGHWEPYYWDILSGPEELAPGETGTYLVNTSLEYETFNLIEGAQAVVTDAGGDYGLRGASKIERDLTLHDPGLVFNSQYLGGVGQNSVPWGWSLTQVINGMWNVTPQGARVQPYEEASLVPEQPEQIVAVDYNRSGVVSLSMMPSGRFGAWEYVALGQWIVFPDGPFSIAVHPPAWLADVDPDQAFYGLEFEDPQQRIWLLFGPGPDAAWQMDDHHYVIYRHAPVGEWSVQTLDLYALYEHLDLLMPLPQVITRNNVELLTRMVNLRLFTGSAKYIPPQPLTAQFGSINMTHVPRQHIERTLDYRWQYHWALADMAHTRRLYDQAHAFRAQAIGGMPPDLRPFFQGVDAYWREDYGAALSYFEQVVESDYFRGESLRGIGWSQIELGDLDAAERAFTDAIFHNNGVADPYIGMGQVWLRRDECDHAIWFFVQAWQIQPGHLDAKNGLAACGIDDVESYILEQGRE